MIQDLFFAHDTSAQFVKVVVDAIQTFKEKILQTPKKWYFKSQKWCLSLMKWTLGSKLLGLIVLQMETIKKRLNLDDKIYIWTILFHWGSEYWTKREWTRPK